MDNTLAAFDQAVIRAMRRRHGVEPASRTHRYIKEAYPSDLQTRAEEVYYEEGFFSDAIQPVEGAKNAVESLRRAGYDLTVCSSHLTDHRTTVNEKYNWLAQHFSDELAREAVFTRRKDTVRGDYLIDDQPCPRKQDEAEWQHIVFDQPYNRDVAKPRITRWSTDIVESLGVLTDYDARTDLTSYVSRAPLR